jgi:DNA-binding NarL/FixJ family response regulator
MRTGPEALTPAERRVAALAATGMANHDIATELVVTPRTVEFHLSATYRKLGVSGRRDLPAALASP